jgi:hypothetical protein
MAQTPPDGILGRCGGAAPGLQFLGPLMPKDQKDRWAPSEVHSGLFVAPGTGLDFAKSAMACIAHHASRRKTVGWLPFQRSFSRAGEGRAMTFAERPQVSPAIFTRVPRRRLQAQHPGNILANCGVGAVRSYRKANGSFRGKECYSTVAYPARMDRWSEKILGQRSFFANNPPGMEEVV